MLQQVYFLKEEQTSELDSPGLELVVQAAADFIGFLLVNKSATKVVAWALYKHSGLLRNELDTLLEKESWMAGRGIKTSIISYSHRTVLIPAEIQEPEQQESVFELMYDRHPDELRLLDAVSHLQAVNLYAVPAESVQLLRSMYPAAKWHHQQSVLANRSASVEPLLQIEIYFNHLFISVENNRQWLLLKSACYQTPEDVLYALLNTIQQLELDPENTRIAISGMVDQQSALANLLHQYIHNLDWNHELTYQFSSTDLSTHTLALADRIATCVS